MKIVLVKQLPILLIVSQLMTFLHFSILLFYSLWLQ